MKYGRKITNGREGFEMEGSNRKTDSIFVLGPFRFTCSH